jgi:polynucleotide 5'-hydroxyl-kinase GRC3/NOL9
LEDLRQARTIVLLGASDTGKTTFLIWLANAFQAQGQRIALVDTDVGQSTLGPPTTIGLSVVGQPFQSLQELTPVALYFVGSTSPRGHFMPMIVGTKRLVARALEMEVPQIIIDTCGFISADGGQALKHYQIDLVSPDVVVCLQRASECEDILRAFRYCQRPRILRLRTSHACRRRSMEERRLYRERLLHRYFAKPKIVTLSWDDLNLIDAPIGGGTGFDVAPVPHARPLMRPEILWAERRADAVHLVLQSHLSSETVAALERAVGRRVRAWLAEELHGTVLGLLNESGEALGIGVVRHLHFPSHHIEVLTAEGVEGICGVHWSRTRMGSDGELRRLP